MEVNEELSSSACEHWRRRRSAAALNSTPPDCPALSIQYRCFALTSRSSGFKPNAARRNELEDQQTPLAARKFAAVRRARCLRSGTWYAAKVMRKRRRAQDVRHEILHEAAVLLLARPSPASAEGGELQRLIDEEESLKEEAVQRYMTNILAALRFLHAHNIAHLDLKPQNLLLTGTHPDSEVKLCDFGISRIILSDIEVREMLGTPDYVAPEILQYEPISLATDMWSVGVLAYVLLTGHSPFGGNTKQETFLNISQGQLDFPEDLFEGVSEAALDFITQLLIVDPRRGINKENRNTLHKTKSEEQTAPSPATPALDTPSPAKTRPQHPQKPRKETEPGARKPGASGKENKENKEAIPTSHTPISRHTPPQPSAHPVKLLSLSNIYQGEEVLTGIGVSYVKSVLCEQVLIGTGVIFVKSVLIGTGVSYVKCVLIGTGVIYVKSAYWNRCQLCEECAYWNRCHLCEEVLTGTGVIYVKSVLCEQVLM
ncbi:Death-associated protein kinase related [Chionoecetes opilio]|uniref:Death-associated protein kinase related n=1 Tax=Chionoecetes opilio TaxID=41210 RepID=A0A8J5CIN4_CHIOP|nr:Death-associated protein kinase related [Chionoecetes opilio]